MSPSAGAHCDARADHAMHHSPSLQPQPVAYAARARLRPRGSGKGILMIPSLVARRDTCMVVLARREVRLDKHARLLARRSRKSTRYICMLVRILTSKKRRRFFSVAFVVPSRRVRFRVIIFSICQSFLIGNRSLFLKVE